MSDKTYFCIKLRFGIKYEIKIRNKTAILILLLQFPFHNNFSVIMLNLQIFCHKQFILLFASKKRACALFLISISNISYNYPHGYQYQLYKLFMSSLSAFSPIVSYYINKLDIFSKFPYSQSYNLHIFWFI